MFVVNKITYLIMVHLSEKIINVPKEAISGFTLREHREQSISKEDLLLADFQ